MRARCPILDPTPRRPSIESDDACFADCFNRTTMCQRHRVYRIIKASMFGDDQAIVLRSELSLEEINVDSLDRVEIAMAIEEEYGFVIDVDYPESKWVTVGDILAFSRERAG